MKHYLFKEIRENGSCIKFMEEILHTPVVNGRCRAVWRNGERETSVAIDEEKWFDHGTGTGGGILELCALAKYGSLNDPAIQQAQEFLGEWMNLPEMKLRKDNTRKSRYDDLLAEGYTEKARYYYTDLDGNTIYFVCRLEHPTKKKEFVQGTPDHWGISGITPIPYNWKNIHDSEWCIIVEGEKDVETLKKFNMPATTNSGGAEKWNPDFSKYFVGKKVCIIPDNDDVGQKHAAIIAKNLKPVTTSLKVITISTLPKGDVTDYFEQEGGNLNDFIFQLSAAPEWEEIKLSPIEAAKEANKTAFSNYILTEKELGRRKLKEKSPRRISDMIKDLHTRLLNAPFCVGEQLFDQDRVSHKINYIYDQACLFSWIARKTMQPVDWTRLDGCITKNEFFEAVKAEAKYFEAISYAPHFPMRDDIFYVNADFPPPSENHATFWGFVDFFSPIDEVNRRLIAAFAIAPIFYSPMIDRPLWIIDSPNGQGSGKSKLPEMIAFLYGEGFDGKPIDVSMFDLERNYQEVIKRIISPKGRNARIFRIDNFTGLLKSSNLASLVTAGSISGRASYGRGEESRPNDLTYVVTVNGATVDTDISSRAYYIMVKKPKMDSTWVQRIIEYVQRNRSQIFADIMDILNAHTPFPDLPPVTRMPQFETQVLQAVCAEPVIYQRAIDFLLGRKEETNTDEDLAKRIEEEISQRLLSTKPSFGKSVINPRTERIFIRSSVLEAWFRNESWIENKSIIEVIRNFSRIGLLQQIDPDLIRYPTRDRSNLKRRSGIMWNYQEKHLDPRIVSIEKGKTAIEILED